MGGMSQLRGLSGLKTKPRQLLKLLNLPWTLSEHKSRPADPVLRLWEGSPVGWYCLQSCWRFFAVRCGGGGTSVVMELGNQAVPEGSPSSHHRPASKQILLALSFCDCEVREPLKEPSVPVSSF